MNAIGRLATGLTEGSALGAALVLFAMSVLTLADILLRWLANSPLVGTSDLAEIAVMLIVAACLPACNRRGEHVRMSFLGAALGARARAWLDIAGEIAVLAFFVLITWQIAVHAHEYGQGRQVTAVLRLSIAPVWWAVTAILALAALVQLVATIERIRRGPGKGQG